MITDVIHDMYVCETQKNMELAQAIVQSATHHMQQRCLLTMTEPIKGVHD